ncbi:hypothetical protein BDD12DRAFT_806266 [Trichophaea hybrida]|nr:hypothetical protein BDD12DRAFT_806266 [Trichophaea hybrida]
MVKAGRRAAREFERSSRQRTRSKSSQLEIDNLKLGSCLMKYLSLLYRSNGEQKSWPDLLSAWDKAFVLFRLKLSPKELQKLDATKQRPVFDDLQQGAKRASDIVEKKKYPFTSAVQSILKTINRITPEHGAGLGCVSVYLAIEEGATSEKLVKSLDQIARMIFRAEYTKLFAHQETPTQAILQQLHDDLVELFAEDNTCSLPSNPSIRNFRVHMIDRISLFGKEVEEDIRLLNLELQQLWSILKRLLECSDGCVCVIDGLDECSNTTEKAAGFVRRLTDTFSTSTEKVAVFSRLHVPDISDAIQWKHLCIEETDVEDDIKSFVSAKLDASPKLSKHREKNRLFSALVEGWEGMMLWVRLMVPELENSHWIEEAAKGAQCNIQRHSATSCQQARSL